MTMKLVLLTTLILGIASAAHALDGYDGDNNPVPGASRSYAPGASSPEVYATERPAARRDGPRAAVQSGTENPNVVMWRGRSIGEDPDQNVRSQILRNATGG